VPAPAPGEQWESVIELLSTEHSKKPEEFHRMIEAMFPTMPKLEMFGRSLRSGWAVWGNEVPLRVA